MNNTKYYFVKYTEMYDGREHTEKLLSNTNDPNLIIDKLYVVEPTIMQEVDNDELFYSEQIEFDTENNTWYITNYEVIVSDFDFKEMPEEHYNIMKQYIYTVLI